MTAEEKTIDVKCKLYKRRWLIVALFMVYAFTASLQWVQFSIITNIITKYYNVSPTWVDWTATIYTASYIICVSPSLYIINRIGVRTTLIIGAVGVCIGTWIKLFSVAPDKFALAFSGQTVVAMSFMLTYGLIGRFTALWFGADEIATAGVLAVAGDQLGACLTFYMPQVFVKNESNDVIQKGLSTMHSIIAAMSTINMLLIILLFKSEPKLPPTIAQAKQRRIVRTNVWENVKDIFSRIPFVMIMISYGLNIGPCIAFGTLLNNLISNNFPNQEVHAGYIGSSMMLCGTLSSFVVGRVLDKTRLFKECAMFLTTCCAISMIFLTWALKSGNLWCVYIGSISLGINVFGYYVSGFQMAIEVTYPISENIATAMVFLAGQISNVTVTVVYGYVVRSYGDLPSNIGLIIFYLISILVTSMIPADLKRQQAENTKTDVELKEFLQKT